MLPYDVRNTSFIWQIKSRPFNFHWKENFILVDSVLDMAVFVSYGNHFSSSTRISMLSLIILVLVCSFSYCSSSSLASSFGSSNVDIDKIRFHDKIPNYHRLLFRPTSSETDDLNLNEYRMSSKDRLLNLLLKSALIKEEDLPYDQDSNHINNRRNIPQSFHAMRG